MICSGCKSPTYYMHIVNENKSNVLNFEFFSSCSEHNLSDSLEQKDKASNMIYTVYTVILTRSCKYEGYNPGR